jgi:hypothetical protein
MVETTTLPEELQRGNTEIPNILLYGVMSRVSGGMWKALCYLCTLEAGEDADLDEIAFATGIEEDDIEADLRELLQEGLVEQRVTLPGDRVVYWLRMEGE